MNRFFAVVKGYEEQGVNLPQRSTSKSAGYDFEAIEDVVVPSIWHSYTDLIRRRPERETYLENKEKSFDGYDGEHVPFYEKVTIPEFFQMGSPSFLRGGFKPTLVKTGVKAFMQPNEKLDLYNRSSNPKKGLILANGVGLVDSDYFENEGNDGHVMFQFLNFGEEDFIIKKGDRIGQGVFSVYLTTDDDNANGERSGGFGSTGN